MYEKKIHISVDYTVYDLCHEIKFENRVESKDNFIFFYSWKSIFLGFLRIQLPWNFLPRQIREKR